MTATVNSTVLTEGNNSDGIIAQSLGGGGGNGGVNVAGNLTFSGAAGAGISVGVGGAGGGAGSGGEVDLTVGADLMTMGDGSAGILAQSLGGSGGNGAVNVAGGITGSSSAGGSINVGVGGVGGSGGGANTVTASVSGNVTTFGSQANAITAQSLGGGGGNGGVNVTAGVTLTGASGGTVGVGVGGAGGAGGTGGAVDFTLDGSARAAGESSNAVTVQSLGGGGGNGGVNVSGGLTFAGGTAGTVSVGVGGRGGTGNIARNVDVDITGDITAEDGSALVAQSIGGGGGNGGLNIAGGINVARGASLAVGVGGFGGSGGNAGAVTVDTREGSLTSEGDFKSAAFIQSLGGGGGDGGINISGGIASDSAIAVGIGGSGDAGGSGGNVTATLASDLSARGIFASGLLAQSIGGGGGRGGVNISGTLSGFTNAKAPSLAFGLGGTGGLGSQAGDVTVDYLGTTAVDGFLSTGLVAQSVGGGGGQGGLNVAANLTAAQRNTVGGSFGIGGSGGSGGDGGIVSMDTDGTIMVNMNPDDDSQLPSVFGIGVMAQSVGGGGGNGGANFAGVASAGATPISVALGGSGAGGGIGGAVTMRNGLEAEDSLIAVGGPGGFGLLAQSIGGGGGNGGFNFNANVAPNRETRATADVRIGGSGGDGGTSGEVNVTNAGRIVTIEGATIGLAAQSIAGGGGNSSTNFGLDLINPSDQAKTVNLNFSLGGVAGNGGMAGNVIVDHSGRIDTNGKDSTGLLAQSIAGGGGSIGGSYDYGIGGDSSLAVALGRQGGTGGMAGTIDVTSSGIITTLGDGAYGLLAQSIAGGGGNSSTTSITASTETGENDGAVAWNGEYSQGHEGGSGGTANTVTVRHSGTISTEGRDASGVLAQSIGGGGGAGGSALIDLVQQILSLPTGGTDSFGVSVQRGGVGGTGGTGGFVDVANTGSVFTLGDRSHGVNAMSIGGGGGEGGSVTNIALAGRGTNFQGEVGLGGAGGTGGAGGDVLAFNTGMIQTTGEASHGLRGQSVGGGGGDAGLVATFTGAFSGSEDQTVSVTANIGATGGSGNSGGNVDVLNGAEDDFENAMILTTGDRSHGIFAQSVGGGGGAGSTVLNFSAASGAGGDGSAAFALNMGGDGGVGGLGGLVSVTNRGLIETQGDEAHGIFAQSVGGGGGNGGLSLAGAIVPSNPLGLNTLLVSLGGSGGEGGDGAAVTVNNFGSILTRGRSAHGIFAQSVGGGGGNASIALSGTNSQEGIILSNGLSAIIGAATVRPGEGGTGGTVTVNSSGNITVLGEDSEAVVAQTVNGGGGGFAFDVRGIATDILGVGFDLDDLLDRPVFEIGAGAQDVFGAESDKVTVNITGTVQAAGARSVGESLQSVGGGGGRSAARLELTADEGDIDAFDVNLFLGSRGGGMNRGGDIESVRAGDLILEGAGSTGLFAQSVGGGGGRSSFAATYDAGVFGDVNLRLGSIGSEENAGGNITLTRAGNVSVAGVGAYGGIVQSVGGGGGSFNLDFEQAEANAAENGSPILLAVSVSEPDAPTRQQAAAGSYTSLFAETELSGPALAGNHTVQLGADGGTSLDGGDISLQFNGDTLTTHDQSTGYLIQSIGGGGGDMRIAGLEGLDVTVGGSNGASGNGGDVSFALNGTIETLGVGSHGLVLQAIGGGGGTVLAGGAATVTTLSAANTGDGGSVALAVDGNVVTRGDGSTAILAQSLGGGGGLVDGVSTGSAGGSGAGDAISLKINGTVAALGEGSTAVYAESDGTTGAGAISVSISEGGSVMAGTGGQAIVFVGGSGNSLSNDGMIATDDMLDGLAITAGSGDDAIVNRGTIIGSVSLGGGDNSFMNVEGGEIFSSQAVDLGAGSGLLTNSGLLDPGGVANTMTTSLTGSFSQTATGLSLIDIDLADRTYDAVNASGTIELNGEVDVTLLNRYQLTPGRLDAAVFTGEGGVTLGDANLTADSTVVLDLKGLTATPNAVNVSYDISFAPEELAGNQVAVGEYLNDIRAAGTDASLDPLWVTLIDETDIDTYADWMSQMGPELYAEQQVLAIEAGEVLAGDMRSCGAASLGAQVSDERLCAWVKGSVGTSERDAADGIAETSNDRQAFTAGAHYALGDIWSIGGGIAYQSDEVTGFGDRWQSDGETLSVALGIRRDAEKLGLGATLVATNATFDSRRAVSVLETAEAVSDRDVTAVSGMIDASYALQYGQLSVVPNAALGVTNLSADGVTETGAGLLNLDVVSSDETVSWLEPGVRVSWDGGGDGAGFMPFADLSVRQVLSGEVTSASARLAAAMSPSDSLMVADSDFGATRLRGEAGLQYGFGNGARLALAYKIEQSDNRNADSAQLRLAMPF
ncbi:MAG: autotransporter outer membrane beta-barrel domain-containing protein [Pseudomonadota bacterium]